MKTATLITPFFVLGFLVTSLQAARLPYIVGGVDVTDPSKWPFMGSFQVYEHHNCGCSLIADRWVVLAAHCLIAPVNDMNVRFGLLNAQTDDMHAEGKLASARIEKIIKHPDYLVGPGHIPNDIALLYTATPVEYQQNPYVDIIPLAAMNQNFEGKKCFTMGWGSRSGKIVDPNYPDYLQEAEVSVMADEECVEAAAEKYADSHVCVHGQDYSSCQGDSGGPLVCDVTGTGSWVLVGVTSWGDLQCQTDVVTVFTSVAKNADWIQKEMGL